MKKLLLILSLILCFATSAKADDTATSSLSDDEWCPNGVVERGAHPTKRYCRSTVTMNWYAALSWCQVQGMQLATLTELCDKSANLEDRWDANLKGSLNNSTGAKKCPNFANRESSFTPWVWTGTANGSTNAYDLSAASGTVTNYYANGYGRSNAAYAICY